MDKNQIRPQKVRVKGNLLSNFEQILANNPIQDYHVVSTRMTTMTWQGIQKKVIKIDSMEDNMDINLDVSNTLIYPNTVVGDGIINTSTITIRCIKDQNVGLSQHTVYVYDNSTYMGTVTTNSSGVATYQFSTDEEGTHTLTFSTLKQNGYNPEHAQTEITVKTGVYLSISPEISTIGHTEQLVLTVTALTPNGYALPYRNIKLYEGERELSVITTDANGQAQYRYSETSDTGIRTHLMVENIHWVLNTNSTIEGYLYDDTGEGINNKKIILILANKKGKVAEATTDANGHFTINHVPDLPVTTYYIAFLSESENDTYRYAPSFRSLGRLIAEDPTEE